MFQRMTSAAKIVAAFAVAFVLVLVLGGVTFFTVRSLQGRIEDLGAQKLAAVEAIGQITEAQAMIAGSLNLVVMQQATPMMRSEGADRIAAELKALDEATKAFEALPRSPETQKLWEEAAGYLKSWRFSVDRVAPVVQKRAALGNDTGVEAQSLDGQAWDLFLGARSTYRSAEEALTALAVQVRKDADASRAAGQSAASAGVATTGAILLAVAAVMGLLGWLVARQIGAAVSALTRQAAALRQAVADGRLDERGDAAALAPEFRPIVQGVNEMMDAFAAPIRMTAGNLDRISRGDLPPQVTEEYRGDFNAIKDSLNRCIATVNALVADASTLASAAVEGKLATRADASRHQGDFRKIVEGVNVTLDAVIGPLEVAARYVDGISKGAIPPKITDSYRGDFNAIKDSLNRCIDAVNLLIADAGLLARAGVEGRLATRADASKHQGDFRKIVEGVNATLDAVIGPLGVAARYVDQISKGAIPPKITDRYAGDFNALKDNLNTCIDAVNLLVADAAMLVDAAVTGRLATRADAARHQGDFRKIVEGVNRTLDAVIAPLNASAEVLERLAQRDLRARVAGTYAGDHARMKDAVNQTAAALEAALGQVAAAVEQVSSAASQIASSSQAVASGASEQASSLQETNASVDSVAGMARQTADNAHQANGMAAQARDAATAGAASVEQMTATMARIRTSAEGTSQIIKDINDIAFQTNLLALNAAVEAARAGEAGRGFAVVSEEVRSLALRSKEAATKTEELIRHAVKETAEGEVACKHLGERLGEIVGVVGKVTAIVGEIAAAAKEQSAGVEQVTRAVSEMDKVTQQNAASAEESSSAASELSGQSEELAALVAGFQLTRATARAGATRPAARAPALPARAPAPGAAPAAAPATTAAPAPAAGRPDPDRVFPMDADTEIRDF